MAGETRETRLKRLGIRSWRRGIREMDLILGAWSGTGMEALSDGDLDLYEALLAENDHDLYGWVTGREAPPDRFADLIEQIAAEGAHLGQS